MPGRGAYNGTTMPSMRVWSQGLCPKVAFDDERQLCVLEQLLLALQRPVETDPSATSAALISSPQSRRSRGRSNPGRINRPWFTCRKRADVALRRDFGLEVGSIPQGRRAVEIDACTHQDNRSLFSWQCSWRYGVLL